VVSAVGVVGAGCLAAGRDRRWWLRTVPVGLAVGVAVAVLAAVTVAVMRPFPELLPLRVLVWIGVAAMASALAVAHRRAGLWRRMLVAAALLAVIATSAVKVNAFYGYRPTLATATGAPRR